MTKKARRTRRPRPTDSASGIRNHDMNAGVYADRRRVMAVIYHAKRLLASIGYDMPRVQVRMTDNAYNAGVLGCARLRGNAIWITDRGVATTAAELHHTVLHELVHTLTGHRHDPRCPLMKPTAGGEATPTETLDRVFLGYFPPR